MVWLTGGALALSLFMIIGLLVLVLVQGAVTFWPGDLVRIETEDNDVLMGEVVRMEEFTPEPSVLDSLTPEESNATRRALASPWCFSNCAQVSAGPAAISFPSIRKALGTP